MLHKDKKGKNTRTDTCYKLIATDLLNLIVKEAMGDLITNQPQGLGINSEQVKDTLEVVCSSKPTLAAIERSQYYFFLRWFGREPTKTSGDYTSDEIREDNFLFKSKKFGITKKWCQFALSSKTNECGQNLLTYIIDLVDNKPEALVSTYIGRIESQII